ncbi:hypothetical protein FSP39_019297 [Pinctada imbricata]|uniref:Uncharacterized protein n=1 Tax=Pinctada imbricata TaxID=66713 RepID=A0AA89BZS4_PINIB|nr:hypothetical protein FSP39_019297 [Pinctada imbricata]
MADPVDPILRKVTLNEIRQDPVVKRHVIGLIFCGAAFLLDIGMSFSPMFWYYDVDVVESVSTTKISVGLWKGCIKIEIQDQEPTSRCYEHDSEDFPFSTLAGGSSKGAQLARMLGVTQLFQCLGLILIAISIVSTFLKLFKWRESSLLTPLGAVHAFWGAVTFIGSAGAFGTGVKVLNTPSEDYTENLHFSFAFAVICGCLSLAGSLTFLIAAKTTSGPTTEIKLEDKNSEDVES